MPTDTEWLGTPLAEIDFEGRRWHPVVVKPLVPDHAKAVRALLARGYQVVAPLCREHHRDKAGRISERVRPLFGRYVFVGAAEGDETRKLVYVPSVQHVTLDRYRRPLLVPPRAIAAMVARMQVYADGVVDLVSRDPAPRFLPGQPIRVLEGAMAGMEGLFVADEGERLRVLFALFGREVQAVIPTRAVSQ